jgi:hypothetical protein
MSTSWHDVQEMVAFDTNQQDELHTPRIFRAFWRHASPIRVRALLTSTLVRRLTGGSCRSNILWRAPTRPPPSGFSEGCYRLCWWRALCARASTCSGVRLKYRQPEAADPCAPTPDTPTARQFPLPAAADVHALVLCEFPGNYCAVRLLAPAILPLVYPFIHRRPARDSTPRRHYCTREPRCEPY